MKFLLTSVFGPFGVDDEYGRKDNVMEVLHNQVTRVQGIFSPRFNQETYGLYLIAENLEIPTVVLDFPSRRRFIRELKKGYDYVGISFITANIVKAVQMARWVRQYSPNSQIILGGHGTGLDGIEKLIECDWVCRGEGIRFLQQLFGENSQRPIRHPIRYSSFNRYILGTPIPNKMIPEGIIMPGVGCVNGCRFCSTSHFFQKQYIPFIETGKDLFDLCREYEEKMGITDFFVLDENFFKSEKRSRELLSLMEKNKKPYSFNIFTSAETIVNMGIDFIQRIGIDFLWVGVESVREIFAKNRGIDFHRLIQELRQQGVSVLVSAILFLEHHTKETIQEDIDFTVSLKADYVQFMQLCAAPGTAVYEDMKKQNRLLEDIPYEEWHGQHWIWFQHPHFTPGESYEYLLEAFKKDFTINGPSLLRMAETYINGAETTAGVQDEFMKLRHRQRYHNALLFYPALDALVEHAPTPGIKAYAITVRERYHDFFKGRPFKVRFLATVIRLMLLKEKLRDRLIDNNLRQPPTLYTRYRF